MRKILTLKELLDVYRFYCYWDYFLGGRNGIPPIASAFALAFRANDGHNPLAGPLEKKGLVAFGCP